MLFCIKHTVITIRIRPRITDGVPAAGPLVSAQLFLHGNAARRGAHFHVGNARLPPAAALRCTSGRPTGRRQARYPRVSCGAPAASMGSARSFSYVEMLRAVGRPFSGIPRG